MLVSLAAALTAVLETTVLVNWLSVVESPQRLSMMTQTPAAMSFDELLQHTGVSACHETGCMMEGHAVKIGIQGVGTHDVFVCVCK